jgi:hypothetical protein
VSTPGVAPVGVGATAVAGIQVQAALAYTGAQTMWMVCVGFATVLCGLMIALLSRPRCERPPRHQGPPPVSGHSP